MISKFLPEPSGTDRSYQIWFRYPSSTPNIKSQDEDIFEKLYAECMTKVRKQHWPVFQLYSRALDKLNKHK